ncbi:hypothetical protein [Streptomyces kebangsaanensis]|uniref:hypothetical protein n=1 Tax=Streptomyces kebangsaanensis TaxID=864058 RepID=UPI0018FEA651|nr:hypothetical protein [Streptomyces kebangsaanensis]
MSGDPSHGVLDEPDAAAGTSGDGGVERGAGVGGRRVEQSARRPSAGTRAHRSARSTCRIEDAGEGLKRGLGSPVLRRSSGRATAPRSPARRWSTG